MPTGPNSSYEPITTSHPPAVFAGFSSWLLDALDYFLVTFTLTGMAREFHKSDAQMALVITMTLLCRPVGGFIFGLLADRYGRKKPLMVNMSAYALAGILTGLAPNFTALLVIRGVFGVVMGGTWGVGTSMAMEGAPTKRRGLLSGVLQEGYAAGQVLAALLFFFLHGLGWRWLFILTSLPSIPLVFYIGWKVKESAVWQRTNSVVAGAVRAGWAEQFREFARSWKLFAYLLAFMTMMMFASHGTQDMYPTFLQRAWHMGASQRSMITAIGGLGAILGGIVVGHFSDRLGRRVAIVGAFVLGIVVIPLWAYAPNPLLLVTGAFLMQFAVQGAWGVIPAHLAELTPDKMRATLPGFAYQCGGVLASGIGAIEALYAARTNYPTAMALTAVSVFVLAGVMAAVGKEKRGTEFGQ
ncbi:MFS transporter [Terracidiphilus gabretensis]|uniref:MFS transporter n=1 Tax=Terracidiphilus gabretensis TaxID=1577687 RepID=UPI00071BB35E|nr:MFS transporter [Terracidiphilus gabretensis]